MHRIEHLRKLLLSQILPITALVFAGILMDGCATTMHLPSHWNENKIVVDGKKTDWDVTYLIDDNKLVIGFFNDSSFVYLLLATNDRPLAMNLMRGITVWFDPQGGTEKTFGIRYPLGGVFGRGTRSGEDREGDAAQSMEVPGARATELEMLGPKDNDRHRMQIMETGGIQAKVSLTGNSFVYELRVPYSDAYPFSINTKPGSVIGLGLETAQARPGGKSESHVGEGREGGGMRGGGDGEGTEGGEGGGMEGDGEGGYGGGGGMRGGGRGGRGGLGRGGSGTSEQLDMWMKVPLLAKDTLAN
jgi:hypothetical protein